MTRYVALVLVLLQAFAVKAQSNFHPGYYINTSSDTVRGLIQNRGNEHMGDFIFFKTSSRSGVTKIYPQNTRLVVLGVNQFEGHSFREKGDITYGFLERIVTGRLILYRFKEKRYFVKKGDEPVHEITRASKVDYSGPSYLREILTDCPDITERYLFDAYTVPDPYIKIVDKYNKCFDEQQTIVKSIRRAPHLAVGIHGSLNLTRLSYANADQMSTVNFDTKLSVTGGIFLSLFHPRMGNKVRIVTEPGFGRYADYTFFTSTDKVSNDLLIDYSFIRAPVLLRYKMKHLFLDAGINNMIIIDQKTQWRQETLDDNIVVTTDQSGYAIYNSLGVLAGIGSTFMIGDRELNLSARFSNLFRVRSATAHQPAIQWIDLNLAFQLNR